MRMAGVSKRSAASATYLPRASPFFRPARIQRWGECVWATYLRLSPAGSAGLHQTSACGCPDSSPKCNKTKDKHNGKNGYLRAIVVIVTMAITVVIYSVIEGGNAHNTEAVTDDDYSTEHSRGNGKTHENTSLLKVWKFKRQARRRSNFTMCLWWTLS